MDAEASLWERSRRAAYAEISGVAMRLFLDQGFEQTTIDQIAAAAGISRRSFFRYFGTKEDVLLGDLARDGERLRDALDEIPTDVGPWEALRRALDSVHALERDSGDLLKIARMMYDTPSLLSRSAEKHRHWQALLLPGIRARLGPDADDVSAAAIIASAIACLDTAGEAWARSHGELDLAELYDRAVAAVRGST
ncbi:TetR/AcrR family transcriptional regulator [Microbacterium sp. SLBN-111]|uniref:TetR/AcrR family transcriptional regulator n=1 Tax=Microbacterium sp. SLBN-111 TaxID=3377733 RepID=UPI003C72ACB1